MPPLKEDPVKLLQANIAALQEELLNFIMSHPPSRDHPLSPDEVVQLIRPNIDAWTAEVMRTIAPRIATVIEETHLNAQRNAIRKWVEEYLSSHALRMIDDYNVEWESSVTDEVQKLKEGTAKVASPPPLSFSQSPHQCLKFDSNS